MWIFSSVTWGWCCWGTWNSNSSWWRFPRQDIHSDGFSSHFLLKNSLPKRGEEKHNPLLSSFCIFLLWHLVFPMTLILQDEFQIPQETTQRGKKTRRSMWEKDHMWFQWQNLHEQFNSTRCNRKRNKRAWEEPYAILMPIFMSMQFPKEKRFFMEEEAVSPATVNQRCGQTKSSEMEAWRIVCFLLVPLLLLFSLLLERRECLLGCCSSREKILLSKTACHPKMIVETQEGGGRTRRWL